MFRKEVKPIGGLVEAALKNNGLITPLLEYRLLNRYDKVVGKTVSQLTTEKYIKNQTLYAKISRPALRSDLSMMRKELVKRLNDEVGSFVISDIKFF